MRFAISRFTLAAISENAAPISRRKSRSSARATRSGGFCRRMPVVAVQDIAHFWRRRADGRHGRFAFIDGRSATERGSAQAECRAASSAPAVPRSEELGLPSKNAAAQHFAPVASASMSANGAHDEMMRHGELHQGVAKSRRMPWRGADIDKIIGAPHAGKCPAAKFQSVAAHR